MQQSKPLTGIRVLECGAFLAGPYTASLLASLGADVVKVEPPAGGDPFRRGEGASSPYFVQMNAGKKSLAVDLKSPDGVALVKSLASRYDVFIENSRPGKMAALGLGIEEIQRINPSIIYASVSGFGDGGPWRDRAAYDTIGLSMSGFLSIMSEPGQPQLAGTCIGDLVTALTTTTGILAALVGRNLDHGRKGTDVRTSLLEAMSTITIDAMTQFFETSRAPTRESRHPQAQNFCLQTAHGGAITLHMSSSQKFWIALTRAMERPDLVEDPRFLGYNDRIANYFELRPIVQAEFMKYGREEWERRLIACDVPFAPALTAEEVVSHPQMKWLQLFEKDLEGNTLVRAPWRFAGERPDRKARAPQVGEHTREVALQVTTATEVDRLIASGVLVQAAVSGESVSTAGNGQVAITP